MKGAAVSTAPTRGGANSRQSPVELKPGAPLGMRILRSLAALAIVVIAVPFMLGAWVGEWSNIVFWSLMRTAKKITGQSR